MSGQRIAAVSLAVLVGSSAQGHAQQSPDRVPAVAPDTVPPGFYESTNIRRGSACITGHVLRGVVVVTFEEGTPQAKKQEAIDRIDGSVVGGIRPRDDLEGYYYVQVEESPDGSVLCEAVETLNQIPWVVNATEALITGAPLRPGDASVDTTFTSDFVCDTPMFVPRTVGPKLLNDHVIRHLVRREAPAVLTGRRGAPPEWSISEDGQLTPTSELGRARLLVCVTENGQTRAVRVEDGHPPELVELARRVALRMRFLPARYGDQARAVWTFLPFRFVGSAADRMIATPQDTTHRVPAVTPDSVPDAIYNPEDMDRGMLLDIVLVVFTPGSTQAKRQAAVESVNGTVVGGKRVFGDDGFYFVEIEHDGTSGPLFRAIDRLNPLPQVETAAPEFVGDILFGAGRERP